MNKIRTILVTLLFFLSGSVFAHSYSQGDVRIGHIWAEAPAPGIKTLSVYMPLLNTGQEPDILDAATCPLASNVDILTQLQEKATPLLLSPNVPLSLRPGGTELVITGFIRDIKPGEMVPLTLKFEKAGTINVKIMIEAPKISRAPL